MLASDIQNHEELFRKNSLDSNNRKMLLLDFDLPIAGTNEKLNFVKCVPLDGDKSYYYEEETLKKRIVLHHTAGYLKGDITTLTTHDNHVSVPFVIARNGTIYNLFPSKYWSYHLGRSAIGGNTVMSKSSVAIEVSNIGQLKLNNGKLYDYYGNIYCDESENQYYIKLDTPWRGEHYFATYTEEQYLSIIKLLQFLKGRYNIPPDFLPEEQRLITLTETQLKTFSGILSHVSFRKDKSDMSPAFDYSKIVGKI